MSMSRQAQLALGFYPSRSSEFDDYFAGENIETVCGLRRWSEGQGARVVYVWGNRGTGKTHLLQAAIKHAHTAGGRVIYVPLDESELWADGMFDGLEELDFLALDDIDACRGNASRERSLFNLFNRVTATGTRLLWSGSRRPAPAGSFELADLASRHASSLSYHLAAPKDEQLRQAMKFLAQRRGLDLSEHVIDYILHRQSREISSLVRVVQQLDTASLEQRRPISVPFVREALEYGSETPEGC